MGTYRHRRGKIVFEVFCALLIGTSSAAGWLETGAWLLIPPAIIATLYGVYRAFSLLARDPAIRFDDKGIELGLIFRTSSYRWNQVREMRAGRWRAEEDLPFKVPSWIPTEREYLELMVPAGAFDFGWINVRADMIELPSNGLEGLVDALRAAQVAALGGRGAAMTRLGMDPKQQAVASPRPTGVQAERFARLGIGIEEEPATEEPSVIEPTPTPRPFVPQRPTFGRKVG